MTENLSEITTWQLLQRLWTTLGLPRDALKYLQLEGDDGVAAPSSFKIGHLAQSSIALSGLLATVIHALRTGESISKVVVDRQHAVAEFSSEKLYLLNGERPPQIGHPLLGLHKTYDGVVRIHDTFPNHHEAALRVLECRKDTALRDVEDKILAYKSQDLENTAADRGAVIYAMRSYKAWDATPQAQAVSDFPITIEKVADSEVKLVPIGLNTSKKCLSGVRVVEMSRVVAAPVAGKTLAAHGADVLWVTSPSLPALPALDMDFGRGKRTIQIDINQVDGRAQLLKLLEDADVFLQSYRPGSLANKGLDVKSLLKLRKGRPMVFANLSAWGKEGPWSHRRGFDSIVQTVTGMNISEAEHYGEGEARVMPCQALDHGSGYLLASGTMTALYRQMIEGGSYRVDVSLAATAKLLRSLGQYEGDSGFRCQAMSSVADVPSEFMEIRHSAFGELRSIKHSVRIEGIDVGWKEMPKPLGSDEPVWLERNP